jgi:hypothetical protein
MLRGLVATLMIQTPTAMIPDPIPLTGDLLQAIQQAERVENILASSAEFVWARRFG